MLFTDGRVYASSSCPHEGMDMQRKRYDLRPLYFQRLYSLLLGQTQK